MNLYMYLIYGTIIVLVVSMTNGLYHASYCISYILLYILLSCFLTCMHFVWKLLDASYWNWMDQIDLGCWGLELIARG
jgi:hypothetical protein